MKQGLIKDIRGMTIVEILAALLILMLAASSFMLCIDSSRKAMDQAEQIRDSVYDIALANAGNTVNGSGSTALSYSFSYGSMPSFSITVRGGETADGVKVFLPAE